MAQTNASQHLLKVIQFFMKNAREEKIKGLTAKQRERIAEIVTGLAVVANPKFHKTLKLSDADVKQILTKLQTDRATADKVATIGTRSPTLLAKNIKNFTHFESRSDTTKSEMLKMMKTITVQLDKLSGEPSTPKSSTTNTNTSDKSSQQTVAKTR